MTSTLRLALGVLPLVGLTGCGYFDSREAHRAQLAMIGMTSNDLQACAGIPASTKTLNDTTQIYQYTATMNLPTASDSTIIPVQQLLNMTQVTLGGAGTTCKAIIRLDHDRVSEVHYAGDDDEIIGSDGICSIITRGCARQPEASMRKVSGGPFGPVSAFHSPAAPNQSTSATYNKQSGETVPNYTDKSKPVIVPRP
ncbi:MULTISPECIES: hypothetical protein [Asaia]|uniref:Lipoprotein n=1 Tax=Asaia bogorensis TaxID=91915 RepID=A0A060QD84_9PROT|nr:MULTISPECIES: hypothetical protein [Asaia]MDL2170826.1 hypothetical protein [Asaia sp. HumB]MDR6183245.1 hypothetical protein [Asaia bogorensis NBRC 16594]CDG39104.1 hypothetical protein ASAP_1059 [Asaia bogorensis]